MRLPAFLRIDTFVGYRWWTVGGGHERGSGCWWLKLGPVSLDRYCWEGHYRVVVCVLCGPEIVVWPPFARPLA